MVEETGDLKRKAGRPKGSKTIEPEVVEVEQTQCPKCGSVQRSSYIGTPRHVTASGEWKGLPYSSVTFRRCYCIKCGQVRIEKSYNAL